MQATRKTALNILIASAVIQLLFPSVSNRFRVRTISSKDGMYISVSKSSPPIAALEDAQLSFPQKVEPETIVLEPVPVKVRILPGLRI